MTHQMMMVNQATMKILRKPYGTEVVEEKDLAKVEEKVLRTPTKVVKVKAKVSNSGKEALRFHLILPNLLLKMTKVSHRRLMVQLQEKPLKESAKEEVNNVENVTHDSTRLLTVLLSSERLVLRPSWLNHQRK